MESLVNSNMHYNIDTTVLIEVVNIKSSTCIAVNTHTALDCWVLCLDCWVLCLDCWVLCLDCWVLCLLGIVPGLLGIVPGLLGIVPGLLGIVPGLLGIVPGLLGIVPGLLGNVPPQWGHLNPDPALHYRNKDKCRITRYAMEIIALIIPFVMHVLCQMMHY